MSPGADWLACGGMNAGIKMIPLNGSGIPMNLPDIRAGSDRSSFHLTGNPRTEQRSTASPEMGSDSKNLH